MPADGRYSSLGRCKGTIRIGSFMRTTCLFVLRATFLSVLLLATRFTGHLHSTGSPCSRPDRRNVGGSLPKEATDDCRHSLCPGSEWRGLLFRQQMSQLLPLGPQIFLRM